MNQPGPSPVAPLRSPGGDPTRLPALDGLRGLAILMVIAHNTQLLKAPLDTLGGLVEIGMDRGWAGVQLFFVLSGFLITGILLDTRRAKNYYRNFFARRALRIFPVYYVTLLTLLVVLPALGAIGAERVPSVLRQIPYWLYVANWTQPAGFPGGYLSHFWSLAIEEQFYLLWPFLIHRLTPAGTLRACAGIALVALLIRILMVWLEAKPQAIYMSSFCRMDALAWGGAAAAVLRIPRLAAWRPGREVQVVMLAFVLAAAGLVVTRGYPGYEPIGQTFGYGVLSIVFALVILAAAHADRTGAGGIFNLLRVRPLRAVGKYSYAMYVFHWPLHDLVGRKVLVLLSVRGDSDILASLAYVAVCSVAALAMAMLSYRFLESPFLRLKVHFTAAIT